jgi:hypothetical protein
MGELKGERLVARVHAQPRSMGPKMDSLTLHYFGLPPAHPLHLTLVDPTDRILEDVETRSVVPAV